MSTYIRDIGNNVVGNIQCLSNVGANTNGTVLDAINGDGRCTLKQSIGVLVATTNLAVQVYESSDNSTFTAISGALITTLCTSSPANTIVYLTFDRTKRYINTVTTITGASCAANLCVELFEQKKQV